MRGSQHLAPQVFCFSLIACEMDSEKPAGPYSTEKGRAEDALSRSDSAWHEKVTLRSHGSAGQ